jgi:hypothetical protein
MARIISVVTMPIHGDCRSKCPCCGVEVTARFTPKVTASGVTSAWSVAHAEPRCREDVLDRIDYSSEDFEWSAVLGADD